MNDKSPYLKQIPVPLEVYEQFQQLWKSGCLDYQRHTPEQAIYAARHLHLSTAAHWVETHPHDYKIGLYEERWRLAGEFTGDVICHRFSGSIGMSALTNVPRSVVHHSPDGHEWGYGGSGPTDLALDILNWFLPPNEENGQVECWCGYASKKAWNLHQQFKRDFIASLPREGGMISKAEILQYIH